MSIFKLEKLIGEGSKGFVRRIGNTDQPIGGRGRRTPTGKNLSSMVARSPEVMVKITGFKSGGAGVKASLNYITRDGKLTAERADGSKLDKEDLAKVAKQWQSQQRTTRQVSPASKTKPRDCMNLALSMPPGTDPKAVLDATRAFAKQEFGKRNDYVFVQHTDEAHPHVHITVNTHGYDGRKLDPKKADLQRWRETFADQLRQHGVDCAATPRPDRGVTLKPERQAIIHIRKRGIRPDVDTARVKEAIGRVATGDKAPRPWDTAITERQAFVRQKYQAAAEVLNGSRDPEDMKTAAQLASFVKTFPAPTTRMQTLIDAMDAKILADRQTRTTDRDQSQDSGRDF